MEYSYILGYRNLENLGLVKQTPRFFLYLEYKISYKVKIIGMKRIFSGTKNLYKY